MRNLFALRMEHVAVAVPHLLVLQSLALLDDLFESRHRGREVDDGDDPAAAAVVQLVGDLTGRVAGEESFLAELAGECLERHLDRFVELADRLELVVFREPVVLAGLLDLHEDLDRFRENFVSGTSKARLLWGR